MTSIKLVETPYLLPLLTYALNGMMLLCNFHCFPLQFQSVFLICDDAMDGSQTRRGQPCWYKLDDVKLAGINDALMIDAAIFHVLKKQFGDEPYYMKLVEIFNEIKFITTVGQSLDLRSARMDVTNYTMDLYKSIVCLKTAYYTFYLPVALAMHMTG